MALACLHSQKLVLKDAVQFSDRLFPSAGLAYSITGRSAVSPQCVPAGPLVRSPLGVSLCGRCGGAGLSGAWMAPCALSSVMKGG